MINIQAIRMLTPEQYQAMTPKAKNELHDALNSVYDMAPLTVQREAKRLGIDPLYVFYPEGVVGV